jgi:hypothetical protein
MEHIGWTTNGQYILESIRLKTINSTPSNSLQFQVQHGNNVATNLAFAAYVPESLGNLIWTNFLAHTNGRDMRIWSERVFPRHATNVLKARWNTNGLMWGMKGLTALSPHWEEEQGSGHLAIAALSRRHGYTRGHGSGENGFSKIWSARKVWFLTAANIVVEVKVVRRVCRSAEGGDRADYTIVLFDRDLPPQIEVLHVISPATVLAHYPFPSEGHFPHPVFMTEQGGNVSSSVWPLATDVVKGGDSGCPNLLPLPGKLVFMSGRTTSGPSAQMQADMDELCRLEKLNPKKYQLQWVDLSKYPTY